MVRFRNALAAAAVVASGVVLAAETPAEAPATAAVTFPNSLTIVAFGSSSTRGVGASAPAHAYPKQLEALLRKALPRGTRLTVVNRGVSGEDADDMARRLAGDVVAYHPDLVVWQTGSNDALHHVPLDRFERETRAGILAMRAARIDVLLMEPQWSPRLDGGATVHLYRNVIRRLGAEMNVKVVRRWDLMQDWMHRGLVSKTEMLSPDGLHMADKGYALLARWVASDVLSLRACRTMASPATRPAS